jgi:hypothetical protein
MRALIIHILIMFYATISHAEIRFIVVEIFRMTNETTHGVLTIDSNTNSQIAVSIRSCMKPEQREKISINEAARVLKGEIQPTLSAVYVVAVLHEGTSFSMARPIFREICDNPRLQLIGLRSQSFPNLEKHALDQYGLSLDTRIKMIGEPGGGEERR